MKKILCMSMTRNRGCKCLNVDTCVGEKCRFHHTLPVVKAKQKIVFKRLVSLSKEQQYDIAVRYYNGNMPWMKGGVKRDC